MENKEIEKQSSLIENENQFEKKLVENNHTGSEIEPGIIAESNLKSSEIVLEKYNVSSWFLSALLGLLLGFAIVVPGISGATIAIIFAMYHKIIYALANITKSFKKCFAFLLPLFLGAFLGFFLGFFIVQQLFSVAPFTIVCLFAGLMLGAFPAVFSEIKSSKLSPSKIGLLILGLILPIAFSLGSIFLAGQTQSSELLLSWTLIFMYLPLGFAISLTQIVPGLSATALLMAFGQFGPLLLSFKFSYIKNNPLVLVLYLFLIIGFILGILAFSKLLNYLLKTKKQHTYFTIVGLSLGSIITMFINPDIYNVYVSWANGNVNFLTDLLVGICLFVVGIIVSFALILYEKRRREKLNSKSLEKDKK